MIYGVKFSSNGKVYYFNGKNKKYNKNINVIVETDKGLQYGKVVGIINEEKLLKEELKDIKDIIRSTTKKDYNNYLNNLKDASNALKKGQELANELNLKMKFLNCEFTFDRKQLLFTFIADDRIDFRTLTKKLAAIYKTRIELRQIGTRDKASNVGGIGPCGRELCCTSFLKKLGSVSINMAKNQNLALNPNKINGLCGRLFCCLEYEDGEYTKMRKGLPVVGNTIKHNGVFKNVIEVDILNRIITVVDEKGNIEKVEYNESIK